MLVLALGTPPYHPTLVRGFRTRPVLSRDASARRLWRSGRAGVVTPIEAVILTVLWRPGAIRREGPPARILSENGPQFTSKEFSAFLESNDIEHSRTRPWHPWTNGRIERLFRTFKETLFAA